MKLARSRLTHAQTDRLLEHFVAGTPARTAAGAVGVNRNTARLLYHRLRELIARRLGHGPVALPAGEPALGLIAEDGAVRAVLRPAPGERLDALVTLRAAPARDVLRASDLRYERLTPQGPQGARTDEFWSLAQRLLRAYNGMPHAHFHLFVAECEWRLRCGSPRRCLHALRHWLVRP